MQETMEWKIAMHFKHQTFPQHLHYTRFQRDLILIWMINKWSFLDFTICLATALFFFAASKPVIFFSQRRFQIVSN